MKNLLFLIIVCSLALSCNNGRNSNDKVEKDSLVMATVKDGVFIHITQSYNDPHRVLMPLKMAAMMAEDKDVLVYMDINAVELLVKEAEDLNCEEFESAQTYIKQLLDKKVGIYACPTCLKMAGFEEKDLIAGVQIAQKERFFDFTKGRIINLDY